MVAILHLVVCCGTPSAESMDDSHSLVVNTDAVLTVNLHTDKWIGDVLAWSFTSAIFFTCPLQMFPAVQVSRGGS